MTLCVCRSTSYNDELAWGAMWLHRATNDTDYLTKAEEFLSSDDEAWAMSWDDKDVGAQVGGVRPANGHDELNDTIFNWEKRLSYHGIR